MNVSNASHIYSILSLVGVLLNKKKRFKLEKVFSWMILIKQCFENNKYKVISVYEPLFVLLFDNSELNSHRNHVILVNKNNYKNCHFKWCSVNFKNVLSSERACLIIPSSKVPLNVIAVIDCLLYNIKASLSIPFCSLLKGLQMSLNVCDRFSPPVANKVKIGFFKNNLSLPEGELTSVLSYFLKNPRYMRKDDIYSIFLKYYCDAYREGILYFKVNEIEGSNSTDYFQTYTVSETTSFYDEAVFKHFLPPRELEVLVPHDISSISTLLPTGLEKYYCKLLKWLTPFFQHNVKDLKPVFILSGPSGVGKSITLEAICSKLGINYMKVDCNNIVASSITQIKVNVINTFKNANELFPVLLHLSHADLLSTDAGGNDPDQLIRAISEGIETITPEKPIIIMFTCFDLDSLKPEILNLSLRSMEMENPTEEEREQMICWLAHRFNIVLTDSALKYAASETRSYTLADLDRMLTLSSKKLLRKREATPLQKEHIKEYIDSVRDKAEVGEIEWEDVGGIERLKNEVLGSLHSSKLMKGLERRGLLLHGPPGTGKTLLARAVANQCNRTFIPVKGPELLNMYVGQSEANIRQVFLKAREASPSILFFDELDSLAPNRGNKSDSGGVMDRVVSQLLAEMDGIDSNGEVFILAATNRPDLIDPALLRPGRFDKLLYVGPCEDSESKEKVLKAITRKFKFQDDFCLRDLVPLLPNEVTGANLYALCSSAWMEAAREIINDPEIPKDSIVTVGNRHFQAALKTVKM